MYMFSALIQMIQGPNFMALLTLSKESALTEAGKFHAYVKRNSWVSRELCA